jgi:lactate racemase
MSRPGFVLTVDERTPPLRVQAGSVLRMERFPLGARVVYPPDPRPRIRDVDAAIAASLAAPVGQEPLADLLRPGMRLTIAVDDLSRPAPPMIAPDVRRRIVEQVLELAARAGIDDVELIVATGVNRRLTAVELEGLLGERVFRSFYPAHLRCHDAEDIANLVDVRSAEGGVRLNRRAAESDLVVHVGVTATSVGETVDPLVEGLSGFPSAPVTAVADSFGDVPVFAIGAALDNATYPGTVGFLRRREWEWGVTDHALVKGMVRGGRAVPSAVRDRMWRSAQSPYGVLVVAAGVPSQVRPIVLEAVEQQETTEIEGQSDVVVLGVPHTTPDTVNSVLNPLAVAASMGRSLEAFRHRPVVRDGGVAIVMHPLPRVFHPVHHLSSIDFFDEVLGESTDASEIAAKYEDQFTADPWAVQAYRHSHAFHPSHPFRMWATVTEATARLGDVIVVGGSRSTAARLGFTAVTTLADALALAERTIGSTPSVTYLHNPPAVVPVVR